MKVRKRKRGKKLSFFMDYRLDGERIRESIPGVTNLKDAEAVASLRYSDMVRRRAMGDLAGPSAEEKALRLRDALDSDVQRAGISEWTRRMEKGAAKNLLRLLGKERRVLSLTGADIEDYKRRRSSEKVKKGRGEDQIEEPLKPRTVNIELQLLKAMLQRLKSAGTISRIPCPIEKLPEHQEQRRSLTRAEAIRLMEQVEKDPDLWDMIGFLLNTGLRRNELFTLRWEAVDLEAEEFRILSKKRGCSGTVREDVLPLNPVALDILHRKAAKVNDGPSPKALIFGIPPEKRRKGNGNLDGLECYWDHRLRDKLREAAVRAKISWAEKLRIHDLRHAFATLTLKGGANVRDVAALLRHRNPTLTLKLYAHECEESMRSAVNSLSLGAPAKVLPCAPEIDHEGTKTGTTPSSHSSQVKPFQASTGTD